MANRFAVPITQLVNDDASGVASGWKFNFYVTGTSTRKDTFSDNALTTANANPVVADSAGRFGDIFLESGTYKVVLTDADDVVKSTADPVAGSLGATGEVNAKTASYTVVTGDATKTIPFDATTGALTATLLAAATATNGFEVTIKKTDSSANAVTIDGNGAETIDGAATLVLRHQNDSVTLRCDGSNWLVTAAHRGGFGRSLFWQKGADIASADPLVLGSDGNFFDVTGTTGVSSITVPAGMDFMLQFDDAVPLTLPGFPNFTTVAGDVLEGFATAADTVQVISFTRADGTLFAGVATQAQMEAGTSNVVAVTPGRAHNHPGAAKAWLTGDGTAFTGAADLTGVGASYNLTSVVDNGTGSHTINFNTDFSSANFAVATNFARLATDIEPGQGEGVVDKAVGSARVDMEDGISAQVDNVIVDAVFFGDQ